MSDIFISYARSTEAQARRVAEGLRALGYAVWRDDELPAHRSYAEVIEERLGGAKAVVVVWSADAVKSEWVQAEADRARAGRKIVQMRVDRARLPMPFDRIQCADLVGWTGDPDAQGWRKVVASVAELTRRSGANPPASTAVAPASAAVTQPLRAVLAFDNLSGDPETAFFSDGVAEEIRDTVARGADLKVVGRASSFQFRGPDKAAAHVAAALGVTHVLDGAVRRSGPRVRISTDLVDCASETTLWSERFDRELSDIFALQDEIAAAVATALKTAFAPAAPTGRIDPAVYELFLRARQIGFGATIDGHARVEAFERVATAAPRFAPAWGALAYARAGELRYGGVRPDQAARRSATIEAAETALALDPHAGVAYLALARLKPWASYAEREALLDKALTAAPNDARCLISLSNFCWMVGRHRDSHRFIQQAFDLDPLQVEVGFGRVGTSFAVRRDDTLDLYASFITRWPGEEALISAMLTMAALVGVWDVFDQMVAPVRRRGIASPEIARYVDLLERLKDPSPNVAAFLLQRVRQTLATKGTVSLREFGFTYVIGLKDEAFDLIGQASFAHVFDADGGPPSEGSPGTMFLDYGRLDVTRDIRFVGLCAKLGLCDYWVKSDRWPDCADHVPYDFRAESRRLMIRP
jgi:TolB-like protein